MFSTGHSPKTFLPYLTPRFGICTFMSPLPRKHMFPIYSSFSGNLISLRLLQFLNALYSILFRVEGSSICYTILSSKTPYYNPPLFKYSSVPNISSPFLNLTVLRLLQFANAPWDTVRSEVWNSMFLRFLHSKKAYCSITFSAGGRPTDSSALFSKHCFPINSSVSGRLTLLRFLQPQNAAYSILFSVDGRLTFSSALF